MAFATIRDVAQKAGVSITAVSQILHGKGRFSDETKALVRRTVDELGYVPDSRAQGIRLSESRTVGLLVPDIRNPFFADLVSSMEEQLYEKGYSTLIGTSAEDVQRQDAFITTLLGQRIDGAIVVPEAPIPRVSGRSSTATCRWCSSTVPWRGSIRCRRWFRIRIRALRARWIRCISWGTGVWDSWRIPRWGRST